MGRITNKLSFYLVCGWAIAASILVALLWKNNQKLEKVNSLLFDTVIESNNLANNASEAYKVFGGCMTNQTICNLKETGEKLRGLNDEKEAINQRILEIQLKLQELK